MTLPAKAALTGILVIVILGIASSLARAEPVCGPVDQIMADLAERFGEVPTFSGVSQSGPIVVMVNPDTGTWTAIKIKGALACMVDAGDGGKVAPGRPNA